MRSTCSNELSAVLTVGRREQAAYKANAQKKRKPSDLAILEAPLSQLNCSVRLIFSCAGSKMLRNE